MSSPSPLSQTWGNDKGDTGRPSPSAPKRKCDSPRRLRSCGTVGRKANFRPCRSLPRENHKNDESEAAGCRRPRWEMASRRCCRNRLNWVSKSEGDRRKWWSKSGHRPPTGGLLDYGGETHTLKLGGVGGGACPGSPSSFLGMTERGDVGVWSLVGAWRDTA